ncbi:MAG: corrinoid protein [Candidatus Glassbacteria bacterium]
MADLEGLTKGVIAGDSELVSRITEDALGEGLSPKKILDDGLIAGMDVVGEKFKAGDMFVPEVLISARAMHAGLDILKPLLVKSGMKAMGKIVMGTVQGDLHDIGKSLVCMMLEGAGFEVIDLGVDVSVERFVSTAKDVGAGVIGMSALLTTTMPVMKEVIDKLREEGMGGKVKVLVGGAPVASGFAKEIGADGYGRDAASAIDEAKRVLGLVG